MFVAFQSVLHSLSHLSRHFAPPAMQPSMPSPHSNSVDAAEREVKVASEQIATAESVISSLQTAGVTTLKQKLQLKKAEEQLAELRKAQGVCTFPAPCCILFHAPK